MRVIAVIAARNEYDYLANLLLYLRENGIDYAVIDNGSDDGSAELLREERFKPGMAALEYMPFDGTFDLAAILELKQTLYQRLDADWLMHLDADEIVHSYRPEEKLADAVGRIAKGGAQAINFDEFVFLPVERDYQRDLAGFQPLLHYYHFEPRKNHKINAWQSELEVDTVSSAGHHIGEIEYRLSAESFALRHYIFKSQAHAYDKYATRVFSAAGRERGWHHNRIDIAPSALELPHPRTLFRLSHPEDRALVRDAPRSLHFWSSPRPQPRQAQLDGQAKILSS